MRKIETTILLLLISIAFASCQKQGNAQSESVTQSYITHSPTAHHTVALEVLDASKKWIQDFNEGNALACVDGYDSSAVMSAQPFGIKYGEAEISDFWTPFITSGATNLVYTDVHIEVANERTAFLSANWSMNVGRGVIYQEKWEKIQGQWFLTYDNFAVLEQFETPKTNATNPVGSHLVLEEVIKASMAWTKGFNDGDAEVCGAGYSQEASMNAIPFASIHNQKDIEAFWQKLIGDGAKNLTYHNPIFKAVNDNSAMLSSRWSMNIGEGKIYQEKWGKIEGRWLLTYDEFEVLK